MPCINCGKHKIEHFRPRRKPKVIPSEQECDLCGYIGFDVNYCAFCKKWLCKDCLRDPVKRFKGMIKEKMLKKKKLY